MDLDCASTVEAWIDFHRCFPTENYVWVDSSRFRTEVSVNLVDVLIERFSVRVGLPVDIEVEVTAGKGRKDHSLTFNLRRSRVGDSVDDR